MRLGDLAEGVLPGLVALGELCIASRKQSFYFAKIRHRGNVVATEVVGSLPSRHALA